MRAMARVDPRACAAHGDCIDVAPQAFALSDDDTAVVIGTAEGVRQMLPLLQGE
jgi:ferredoxin